MARDDGKPREEKSWEEFHPDLDLDAEMPVYTCEEVDGTVNSEKSMCCPRNGLATLTDEQAATPILGAALQLLSQQNGVPLIVTPPKKRGPGRPPKNPNHLLIGLGSPTIKIVPAPNIQPKEKLNLPKPHYRPIDTFADFEHSKSVGVNFVDKSLSNVGFQESDLFLRPAKTYIRYGDDFVGEEYDAAIHSESGVIGLMGRVEYDMDEQDERWLDSINDERRAEGVDPIRPAIFEITITQVEKEWHALEKRKCRFLD
jgi:NuA3 HAT complex component NTO1